MVVIAAIVGIVVGVILNSDAQQNSDGGFAAAGRKSRNFISKRICFSATAVVVAVSIGILPLEFVIGFVAFVGWSLSCSRTLQKEMFI